MRNTNLRAMLMATSASLLAFFGLGCGFSPSPENGVLGIVDELVGISNPSAVADDSGAAHADGASDATAQAAATDESGTDASQLIAELQALLAGENVGPSSTALSSLLSGLATVGSDSSQPTNPVRQLRAQIHQLRHSMTRAQAAQLFLTALVDSTAASGAAASGDGATPAGVLTQVQNLLSLLNQATQSASSLTAAGAQ